ncbi:MAG: hypothetical protein HPY74_11340 [Firmicutes bacterium]|nr:hypothetical protein [Bacillota bacterium]
MSNENKTTRQYVLSPAAGKRLIARLLTGNKEQLDSAGELVKFVSSEPNFML